MSWQPQHPEADTTDKFELAEPSENTNLMEGKSTADDHVFSELKKLELRRNNHQGIFFDEIRNLWDMDMLEVSYQKNSKIFPGLRVQVNKTLQTLFCITMFAFLFIHYRRTWTMNPCLTGQPIWRSADLMVQVLLPHLCLERPPLVLCMTSDHYSYQWCLTKSCLSASVQLQSLPRYQYNLSWK